MRQTTLALLSATLLTASATVVGAQDRTDQQEYGFGHLENGPTFGDPMPRSEQRAMLREQMRDEGFRDIRISDAIFFVQARTPDGRFVMMAVSPETGDQDQAGQRPMAGRQGRGMQDMRDMQDRMAGQQPRDMMDMQQGTRDMQGQTARRQQQDMQQPDMQDRMARRQQTQDRDTTGAISAGMGEERIRSRLQERGFSGIRNWTREDGVYTATADWYGEEVDLRVDAQSGDVLRPNRLEDTQIETLLQDEGFENIRNVRTDDGQFRARADRNGSTYTLQVDPETGRILGREEREG